MAEFVLEEEIEKVENKSTKEYLKEVISSYNIGNYRASITVLYTIIIYDLLQKTVTLKDTYNDKGAEKILSDIRNHQRNNPKSPEWEGNLIDCIYNETKLITAVEKEELAHIKNERNYAAHPIINIGIDNEDLQLKHISKETARDCIRKAFEIVFLRDAILAKNMVEDIVNDLNDFYNRVGTDGLEDFLNARYFRRMTQERKNDLFKSLWKFVFILSNAECDKNRESNYYGLEFLFNENKDHYTELIKGDENFYLNKLQLETIAIWSKKKCKDIEFSHIIYFKSHSRVMSFIKYIERFPVLYRILNDFSKTILVQSINHMYTDDDVIENDFYKHNVKNKHLIEEQIKLKSTTMFLSENIPQHFKMIHKMINNYTHTTHNWTSPENYKVIDSDDLDIIYNQSEYRGCVDEFLIFLINYCAGAQQYNQTNYLFNLLVRYKMYFKEEHFYVILARMNGNSQYYENREKTSYINLLENIFKERFDTELVKSTEEKYLYRRLYDFNLKNNNYSKSKILELVEKRASNYSIWELHILLDDLLDIGMGDDEFLERQTSSSYTNIMRILNNEKDPNFKERYVRQFVEYFKSHNLNT